MSRVYRTVHFCYLRGCFCGHVSSISSSSWIFNFWLSLDVQHIVYNGSLISVLQPNYGWNHNCVTFKHCVTHGINKSSHNILMASI